MSGAADDVDQFAQGCDAVAGLGEIIPSAEGVVDHRAIDTRSDDRSQSSGRVLHREDLVARRSKARQSGQVRLGVWLRVFVVLACDHELHVR